MNGSKKLAILVTHPIQYQAHWFRALASHPELEVEVLFCHKATPEEQASAGFGVVFDWDIPLLDGYPYRFLNNVSRNPSVHRFNGLDTPEVEDMVARNEYDAVLVSGWNYKSAWQAIGACRMNKIPVMARSDSHLNTPRHLLKRITRRFIHGYFIPRLDACLAVGKWSRDYFLHYGACQDRIFLVPHVIEERLFTPGAACQAEHRTAIRAQWALREDACVFLFVGKFVDKKCPMDFIRAIELASESNHQIMGLMVGDGPLFNHCRDYVQRKNVPVRFAGFVNQSEIVRAYVVADSLVLPSNGEETWGIVVNEAMTCGKAAIVSDQVGCGPDLITGSITGSIFPFGDVKTLSYILASCASEPGMLKAMGVKAGERIKKYSVRSAVEGVIQALEAVERKKK